MHDMFAAVGAIRSMKMQSTAIKILSLGMLIIPGKLMHPCRGFFPYDNHSLTNSSFHILQNLICKFSRQLDNNKLFFEDSTRTRLYLLSRKKTNSCCMPSR